MGACHSFVMNYPFLNSINIENCITNISKDINVVRDKPNAVGTFYIRQRQAVHWKNEASADTAILVQQVMLYFVINISWNNTYLFVYK